MTLSLLTEFPTIRTDDYSQELLSTGLPLMFSMLVTSKVRPSPTVAQKGGLTCYLKVASFIPGSRSAEVSLSERPHPECS